jgi:hypothetical protein
MSFFNELGYKPKVDDEPTAISSRFSITKKEDDKRQVFGWALISHRWVKDKNGDWKLKQLIDHQGDIVDEPELEEMAYNFVMKYREAGEMHMRGDAGECIESLCMTVEKQKAMGIPEGVCPVGWWIGFYISDDKVWEGIKSGKYKDFSIEGAGIRKEMEIDVDDYDIAKKKDSSNALSFNDILKHNPYHDARGRFTSGSGATSFSLGGSDKQRAGAIAREKERTAGMGAGAGGGSSPSGALNDLANRYINEAHLSVMEKVFGDSLSSDAKLNLKEAYDGVLEHGKKTGNETLSHVNVADGKDIGIKLNGNSTSVTFTPELILHLRYAPERSIISIHNHPNNSSFSPADMDIACRYNSIKAMTVKAHDGTIYSLDIGQGKRYSKTQLNNSFEYFRDQKYDDYYDQVVNKGRDMNDAWKEHSHEIITAMAAINGWDYRRVLPNE